MPDKPTLADVLKYDDPQLRRLVTTALEPGPWEHRWNEQCWTTHLLTGLPAVGYFCSRCHKGWSEEEDNNPCPVPPEAAGSWADLAERLLRKTNRSDLLKAIDKVHPQQHFYQSDYDSTFHTVCAYQWFIFATPRERVICLLLALGAIE